MKLFVLSGKKQSGKNTCGEFIEEFYRSVSPKSVVKFYSFADVLKRDICINILGLTEEQCYGEDSDKNTMTGIVWNGQQLTARQVMQIVGTDIFRSLMDNVWTSATFNKIKRDNPDVAIITDCRFPNEVSESQGFGGTVIRLTRHVNVENEHSSEMALDKEFFDWFRFNYIIDNEYMTLEEQKESIFGILERELDKENKDAWD